MDMSTIEQKLNNLEYETVDDFVSDMNLIFNNCYLYNGTEALVSQCASNVETAFNKLLRRMPKEQNPKAVAESTSIKEMPKRPSVSKPKKESVKKEEKKEPKLVPLQLVPLQLVPLQLVTPGSTALTGPSFIEHTEDTSEDRRPKRDIHVPSKEIQTGVSSKRKGTDRWKTDPQLRHCQSILREFSKKSNAEFMFPFMEPVDWEKLQIPEYPKIIKNPMDMGTVRQKLENDEYDEPEQFEEDIRLVIRNCFTFNPAGTPVHAMGLRMEKLFNNKWAQLPPPPTPPPVEEVDVDSEGGEESEESDSSDDKIAEMERHLKSLSEKLETMKATKKKERSDRKSIPKITPEKPKPKPAPVPSAPKEPAKAVEKKKPASKKSQTYTSSDEDDDVPIITFEQKKELSERINEFEGHQLATVVQIIHDSMPHLRDSGGQEEIELDMDSLDPRTLHKLYQYVRGSAKRKQSLQKNIKTQYSQEDASKKITELEQTLQKLPQVPHGKVSGNESKGSSGPSRSSKTTTIPPREKAPAPQPAKLNGRRKKSSISRSISKSPPSKKLDDHWLDESLTAKTTMSFDVAPLDLIAETTLPKTTAEPEADKDKQNQLDEITQLENMELWADFTNVTQNDSTSNSTSGEGASKKHDPAWEQFQRDMKARMEKEQQLHAEQVRKEKEAREENERRRQEELKRQEQEKERKREIAREAYLREQRKLEEIQKKREEYKERLRHMVQNAEPLCDQQIIMHEFEKKMWKECRKQMKAHDDTVREHGVVAAVLLGQFHQHSYQESSAPSVSTPGAGYGAR
ncbi:hypothetical protein BGZ65_006336, partial [Modicella reniformis]